MSDSGVHDYSGSQMAAVLLMTLGEEDAAAILKHMGPKEVQSVGGAMATLGTISKEHLEAVLDEFMRKVGGFTALGIDSESYIRRMMVSALGEERAGSLMDRILTGGSANGLESLKWLDARSIAEMIRNEHPQIVAIVLSYLEGDQAAAVLSQFPERVRIDLILRISTLDAVQPMALNELNEILEQQVTGGSGVHTSQVGGVKTAAELLNFVDSGIEAEIMEKIKESDPELGQQIQDLMFVFDNLRDVDDQGIQTLLREVSSDVLLLALKGADEDLKEKFFRNMSKRAAEMLRDDLDAKGPVRLSEVEGAQKEVVNVARRMAEDGQIMLGGGGEEFV